LKKKSVKIKKDLNAVIIQIKNLVKDVSSGYEILGVGIGCPGPLDSEKGVIKFAPNLGWRNIHLKKIVQSQLKKKIEIENDAKCFALGEIWKGEGMGIKNFVLLTLGTGVGGAIVINGKLYKGCGSAGEIGHMVIDVNGPKCSCGRRGCLEEFVSERGIVRLAKKKLKEKGIKIPKKISPEKIEISAKKGCPVAKEVWAETANNLKIGLANIINIFDPEKIILSGGISKSNFLFENLRNSTEPAFFKNVKIVRSRLQEDAGILGAASLILHIV